MAGVVALVEEYTVSVSHTKEPSVMTLTQMVEGLRDAYDKKARIYSITLTGLEVGPILAEYNSMTERLRMPESEYVRRLEDDVKRLQVEANSLRALVNDCPVCSQLHKFYGLKP